MNITLRPGRPEDADVCGAICFDAFKTIAEQHNFPPDLPSREVAAGLLQTVLSVPGVYSVVAEDGGRVVGSNFLWMGDGAGGIAGVGPLTVTCDVQNGSVGRRMMENVLQHARENNGAGVRLVQAAFHNRSLSLYAKLGFEVREPLAAIQGPPLDIEIPGYTVRAATTDDLDACDAVYFAVHGHHRRWEVGAAIAQNTAQLVEHDGRVTGYTTGVGFMGYTVAENNVGLQALIGAAPQFAGPGFLLPTRNAALFRWCLEHGLRVIQPMTLMSLGLYKEPAGAFLPSVLF